jgi:1-phosphatidylinositol-3-phosphate 5-kinase
VPDQEGRWLTADDRFIAKEISRLEMDALTKFAPAYFEYTKNAIQGQASSPCPGAGHG